MKINNPGNGVNKSVSGQKVKKDRSDVEKNKMKFGGYKSTKSSSSSSGKGRDDEFAIWPLLSSFLWMARKLFFTKKSFWSGLSFFSLIGLVLGVASLVASMAVMSGFESTLKSAMIDVTGHIRVVRSAGQPENWQEFESRLRKLDPEIKGLSRFTFVEGIVAHQGQINGVLIQGIDPDRYLQVLNFSKRIQAGDDRIRKPVSSKDLSEILIGKGVAERLKLKVGDQFQVVLPVADRLDPNQFHRRMKKFTVRGIMDLGKFEWNQRMMVTDLASTQELAEIGEGYSGVVLRYENPKLARDSSLRISEALGAKYNVHDWYELSKNLFDAVDIERVVIFFVVLIIVIVAAFNITSTLFVTVMKRYGEIAILKTMGARRRDIVLLFGFQGLFVGLVGVVAGFGLGYLICESLQILQSRFPLLSGAVYKIEKIDLLIRWQDLSAIFVATILICLLASLAPAFRGARLNPVEGLKYG